MALLQQQSDGADGGAPQPSYLRRLNPEQHAAVTHTFDEPLCIIAGAGAYTTCR